MVLSDERKARLAAYCRIDQLEEGEETLLQTLYDAAVGYLEGAGISEPQEGTPRRAQYDLCVNYLVLDSYDQRCRTIPCATVTDNPAFRRLINQLELTEPVSNLGTGS